MSQNEIVGIVFIILSSFGGMAAVIGAAGWAKAERIRAERMGRVEAPSETAQTSAVLAELKALKQQMAERHSTSHQFDISFDEALGRLEGRVGRMETKSAASVTSTPADSTLRNGQGQ